MTDGGWRVARGGCGQSGVRILRCGRRASGGWRVAGGGCQHRVVVGRWLLVVGGGWEYRVVAGRWSLVAAAAGEGGGERRQKRQGGGGGPAGQELAQEGLGLLGQGPVKGDAAQGRGRRAVPQPPRAAAVGGVEDEGVAGMAVGAQQDEAGRLTWAAQRGGNVESGRQRVGGGRLASGRQSQPRPARRRHEAGQGISRRLRPAGHERGDEPPARQAGAVNGAAAAVEDGRAAIAGHVQGDGGRLCPRPQEEQEHDRGKEPEGGQAAQGGGQCGEMSEHVSRCP